MKTRSVRDKLTDLMAVFCWYSCSTPYSLETPEEHSLFPALSLYLLQYIQECLSGLYGQVGKQSINLGTQNFGSQAEESGKKRSRWEQRTCGGRKKKRGRSRRGRRKKRSRKRWSSSEARRVLNAGTPSALPDTPILSTLGHGNASVPLLLFRQAPFQHLHSSKSSPMSEHFFESTASKGLWVVFHLGYSK